MIGRAWYRIWLLALVAGVCTAFGTGVAAARPHSRPSAPNPVAAARYLARQRAGYGSPVKAARLAAKAFARAQKLRAQRAPRVAGRTSFANAWTPLGPTPVTQSFYGVTNTGRVDSVAVAPSGEIYTGTAGGGVWSSTDGGKTWQTHTDQVSTGLAIGALAIDPNNQSVIYAGTGEANNCGDCFYGGGVLKSTDGGQTWVVQNPGDVFTGVDFSSLAVDPHNSQVVYAGTTTGLYVSRDGGTTWAHPAGDTSTNAAYGVVLGPVANPSTVFVATTGVGVQKSTDGGQTFTTLGGGLPGAASFGVAALGIGTPSAGFPTGDKTMYAAVQLNGTTNPDNAGDLEMFKSVDGGTTWTFETKTPAYTNTVYAYGPGGAASDQASYDNTLAVDPTNPSHLIAGGIAAVETTDGGTSWTAVNGHNFFTGTNVIHPDFHAMTFLSPTSTKAIIGCDGGVFEYNTGAGPSGVSSLNTDQDSTQFYEDLAVYNNGAQILGGLQDNGTGLYTGKSAWPDVNSGDGGDNAINPLDPKQQFGEADGSLYATSDAWATTINNITPNGTNSGNFIPPIALIPNATTPDSPTLFYGGSELFVTHNPGASTPTWAQITTEGGGGVSAIRVSPSNPAVMYVGFDDGKLFVSTNATSAKPTFTDISSTVGNWITHIDVDPTAPGSIALSYSFSNTQSTSVPPMVQTGAVTLTGKPSATYTDITGNLPTDVSSNSVVFDSGSLVVATDVGVFSTSAPSGSSTHWTAVGTALPNVQVIGLTVDASGNLYAATHGRGVWTLNTSSAAAAPTVTGVSPSSGPAAGGTAVTITGTSFSGANAVTFGTAPAASFTVNSASQITATAPPGSGTVDVTVTTPAGQSPVSTADQFTYQTPTPPTPPAVTAVSPNSGPSTGGTSVTIAGTNLAGATAITFGTTPAASFTVDNAGQITATSPAGTGTVDVTVTTPAGTSAAGPADRFTYVTPAPAAVTSGTGAFGHQIVGTTSAPHTFTVSNTGSATLSFVAAAPSLTGSDAGDYQIGSDGCSSHQLAAGGSCTVQVVFAPTSPGAHDNASLQIADNAAGSPQSLGLSGTGVSATPTPTLTQLKQSARRWRVGSLLAKLVRKAPRRPKGHKTPVGTVLTFNLNATASVKLSFAEHRHKKSNKLRGSLTLTANAGTDRILFDGRISRHSKLGPGTYTVTITATDSAGHSTPHRLTFTILK